MSSYTGHSGGGDRATVYVEMDGGVVRDIRFQVGLLLGYIATFLGSSILNVLGGVPFTWALVGTVTLASLSAGWFSLANALGLAVTAEGIETVELATTLATLGCASGQGYYFARPLEAEAALEYWKSRRRG